MSMSAKVVMMARQQNYDAKVHALLKDVTPDVVPREYLDHLSFVNSQGGKTRYQPSDLPEFVDLTKIGELSQGLGVTGEIAQIEVVLDLDAVKRSIDEQTARVLGR